MSGKITKASGWQTTDGRLFIDESEAQRVQDLINYKEVFDSSPLSCVPVSFLELVDHLRENRQLVLDLLREEDR